MSKVSILLCLALLICSAVSIPTGTANSVTDIDAKIAECENRCPTTDDIFRICGSDGVTYINQSELLCKDSCGEPHGRRVHKVSVGPCPGKN